jgi:hypothetical protein
MAASRDKVALETIHNEFKGDDRAQFVISRTDLILLAYKMFYAGYDAAITKIAEG